VKNRRETKRIIEDKKEIMELKSLYSLDCLEGKKSGNELGNGGLKPEHVTYVMRVYYNDCFDMEVEVKISRCN